MWIWTWIVIDNSLWIFSFLGNNNSLQNIVSIIIIILIFLWIISIIRTARDISRRTSNIFFQVICVLFVTLLTPIIGLPIYWAIRPIVFQNDRIPRREATASQLIVCHNCKTLNPKEYSCCVACGEHLKTKCKQCNTEYPHDYLYCNNCGAPNIEA